MDAIKELKEGNKRYVEDKLIHPNRGIGRRGEIVAVQNPKFAVLCCSDSRVPPEIIFDQGLGDIFVVRIAGNILSDESLGSIEYAVEHLGVRNVVVMGHAGCGAVIAAVNGCEEKGYVKSIIAAIRPAVESAMKGCAKRDLIQEAALTNVRLSVERLCSIFEDVNVIGAYYNLDTGKVDFL